MRRCRHCGGDRPRRRDGICDACHTYRYDTGGLPSERVILRRWQRRFDKLMARGA